VLNVFKLILVLSQTPQFLFYEFYVKRDQNILTKHFSAFFERHFEIKIRDESDVLIVIR